MVKNQIIDENNIGKEGAIALAQGLKANNSLEWVYLSISIMLCRYM